MNRITTLLIGLYFLLGFYTVKANEGMWLLSLMKKQNLAEMQEMGLKLTAEDIYSINNSSLKDAIVGLGRENRPFRHFCTAEIVSGEGLILTNHHCGFDVIQSHSSIEHDYLADGFWAFNKSEELVNPGITASILVRMEDVTTRIVSRLNDNMSEKQRADTINKLTKEIEQEAEQGTYYKAKVKSMFEDNRFFLSVYVVYKDVRLVGAPPQSIGKFGGDTDNWMWPRHTGDFAIFRIYTGPDGKPASYSKNNIPLKPKHHLPISLKGVKEGDFSMIMGFPGTTERYLTSFGLKEVMEIQNTNRFNIRTKKLEILHNEMMKDEKIRLQYASKHAQSANYWKYSREQNKALMRLHTIDVKKDVENKFLEWANAAPERKTKYENALKIIEKAYNERKVKAHAKLFLTESLERGAEITSFAVRAKKLHMLLAGKNPDLEEIRAEVEKLRKRAKSFYKNYNPPTDQKLMTELFRMFSENVAKSDHPDIFRTIEKKYKNNFAKFAKDLFKKSIFADETRLNAFLDDPQKQVLDIDPAYIAGISIAKAKKSYNTQTAEYDKALKKGKRLFADGIMQMNREKALYPDANSTLRLSYGKVGGYIPRDAVSYNYFTTIDGVMEKEDPGNEEFIVPEKLKELYKNKKFGQYSDPDGNLITCFLTDDDITGGNSGSPVMNANGELIGIAFDGNSEAMSGDIDFAENLQKCINVDIRYVLFIIDKYAGAKHLIDEMTLVK